MLLAKKVLIQVDLHMVMQKYNDHRAHELASAVLDSKLACWLYSMWYSHVIASFDRIITLDVPYYRPSVKGETHTHFIDHQIFMHLKTTHEPLMKVWWYSILHGDGIKIHNGVNLQFLHGTFIFLYSDTAISTQSVLSTCITAHNHSEWDSSYKDRVSPVRGSSWVLCSCISSHWPGTACSFRSHSCAHRPWNSWWTCTHQTVCVCVCVLYSVEGGVICRETENNMALLQYRFLC